MARGNTATLDGLEVGYGTRDSVNEYDAVVHTYGRISQAEIRVDHTNIANFADAVDPLSKHFEIPVGSVVLTSQIVVEETFLNLTSLVVGLKETDGTTVDPDGLHAAILLAALTDGDVEDGAGALVGTELAQDSVLSITVTGTAPTAGKMAVLIEYREPLPAEDAPAVITGIIGSL
jgi:hypothetical protein